MNNLFVSSTNVNWQAQGVLACLRRYDGLECSWEAERGYTAEPEVNEWHNGREVGYVISLRSANYRKKLNIAFFEHRNSDSICAVVFEHMSINPPTINDIPKTHPYYESKWEYDKGVSVGQFIEMSDWIIDTMSEWWQSNHQKTNEI